MMKSSRIALAAFAFVTALAAQAQTPVVNPEAEKQDWIALFNGQDLKGWTPKIAKHDLGDNFANTSASRMGC
jgi:hypothetical protein